MRTLLVWIAYNGTRYHGYQVQRNAATIAGTFQKALESVLGEAVEMKGCSRTDAGVHANRYGISFVTHSSIPCGSLVRVLNTKLPPDIAALDCEEREEGFHARYSCLAKRYVYRIRNSDIRSPFEQGQVLLYRHPLDEALLHGAAQGFVGTYDYRAFCSAGGSVEDTVRTIYQCGVTRRGELVEFYVVGNGFLYNMVRIMVGTLLEVAAGKIPPAAIREIVRSGDRNRAGATAPPQGLYLDAVYYDALPPAGEQER